MANSKTPTGAALRKLVSVMFPNASRVSFGRFGYDVVVGYPAASYDIRLRSHSTKEDYYTLSVWWQYHPLLQGGTDPRFSFSVEHREDFLNGTPLRKSMSHILHLLDQRKVESLAQMTTAVTTER